MPSTVELFLVFAICLLGGFSIMKIADDAFKRQDIICQEGC